MSSVQLPPESASRAGRLDQILRDLLHQTPGVEAAAVVSFDGLPMASALPPGMDEDRVAAMSAALLSLAERAAQGLGRGDLSQVFIEGEHGTVFLVSAQDEGVLIAVTTAGAKVGMMLYEVKLAATRVGEVLHGPTPLPAPLPSHVTRSYLDAHETDAAEPEYAEPEYAEPEYAEAEYAEPEYPEPAYGDGYADTGYAEPSYQEAPYAEAPYADASYSEPAYAESSDSASSDSEPAYAEPASSSDVGYYAVVTPAAPAPDTSGWSSYSPSGSVLPGEPGSWS
jgi:uncharacterized protein